MMIGFLDMAGSRDLPLGGGFVRLISTAGFLHFVEARPYVQWNGATGNLDRLHRSISLDEGDHEDSQRVEKGMLVLGHLAHVRADRSNQAVTEENSQEGADQSG